MKKCQAQSALYFAHSARFSVEIFHVNQSDMPFPMPPMGLFLWQIHSQSQVAGSCVVAFACRRLSWLVGC